MSKVRLTQFLNLLRLSEEIQDYVRGLGPISGKSGITERELRSIATLRSPKVQRKAFLRLLRKRGLPIGTFSK